jgi:hypothetical protein
VRECGVTVVVSLSLAVAGTVWTGIAAGEAKLLPGCILAGVTCQPPAAIRGQASFDTLSQVILPLDEF